MRMLWGIFAMFGLAACEPPQATSPQQTPPDLSADTQNVIDQANRDIANAQNMAAADLGLTPAAPQTGWRYDSSRDEMRNATSRTATIGSENQVNLGFPYGDVRARIIIRERPQDGLNILLAVDQGQILCRAYRNSQISVKFDDGPIETFGCDGAADGTSDVAFFQSEQRFLDRLRRARRLIVEADFYNAGSQQFTFNVAGLRWE